MAAPRDPIPFAFRVRIARALWAAALVACRAQAAASCPNPLDTVAGIQAAMRDAVPVTTIHIAPGVYVGDRSTSGDPSGKGRFYSGRSGTEASPIVLTSCDPAHPAVLSGASVSDSAYGIHLTGDHWQIRDLVVTRAQKGVVIDNGNHNLLRGLEVHEIGDEGVHFRDGSSYNTIERSRVHDTGNDQPGFGEGVYVGSDAAASYEHAVAGNVIREVAFAGGITAEHIDIKEGATGTVVEFCTFDGTGISGANSADSFVDIKGVHTIVRFNRGYRNGNSAVSDAFQVRTHGSGYPTGVNNSFYRNTVDLDGCPGYLVYATSATSGTTACDDLRVGGGNLYSTNVTVLPTLGVPDPAAAPALAVCAAPNPVDVEVTFSCDVDRAGPGIVSVFDVTGRRVAEIAAAQFQAGRHVFRWDGRTADGTRAGRGIYIVRMSVNRREVAHRFVLRR
jgi:hypothetical protein